MRGLPLGLWFSWETSGDSVTTLVVIRQNTSSRLPLKWCTVVVYFARHLWQLAISWPPQDLEMECQDFWNCQPHAQHLKFLNVVLYSSLLSSGIHSGMFLNWWMIWIATRSCLCRLPDSWRKKLHATVSLLLMQYRYTLEVIPNYSTMIFIHVSKCRAAWCSLRLVFPKSLRQMTKTFGLLIEYIYIYTHRMQRACGKQNLFAQGGRRECAFSKAK